jgi:hypothetical protein
LIRYGFLTCYLEYFIKALRVREGLPELVRDWSKVGSSARPKMTADEFTFFYFGEQSHSDIYRAQCLLQSVRTLDGCNLTDIGINTMAGWVQYVFELCNQDQSNPEKFLQHLTRLWGQQPQKGQLIYLDGHPISIHDILEYFGVLVEISYHVQDGGQESRFPADLLEKTYLQILNTVKEYLPHTFDYSAFTMANEIEALLELSLWIPLWPSMSIDDLPEHAIHLIPSYRLGCILDACEKLNLPFTFSDKKDVEEISPLAKEFQEAICDYLNWKTPSFIAERWHAALGEIEQTNNSWNKFYFHHPRSRRLAWSRQLILEFGNEPVSGPMLAGSRHYGKINFPTIYNDNDDEQGYIPNGEIDWPAEDRHFQKIDVLLFSAARSAVNKNEWDWIPTSV